MIERAWYKYLFFHWQMVLDSNTHKLLDFLDPMPRHNEWWNHWILFLWRSFANHQTVMNIMLTWYKFDVRDKIDWPWVILILSISPLDFVHLTFINNCADEVEWTCWILFLYNPTSFELIMTTKKGSIFEVLMIVFLRISLIYLAPIIIGFRRFYWHMNICKDCVVSNIVGRWI